MHPITKYTYLGFLFNSLVDKGEILDFNETLNKIYKKKLFTWLKDLYPNNFDISLYPSEELDKIQSFFEDIATNGLLVSDNGLCLLVAYCLQGIQNETRTFNKT